MYMPSPYNALVRRFLRALEAGTLEAAGLEPLVAADALMHVRTGEASSVQFHGPAGVAGYLTRLRDASGGTLALKPQAFELRDRGAYTVLHLVGTRDGEEFTEQLRLVLGMAEGRVKELWFDPSDLESFERAFGAGSLGAGSVGA